jgi:ligand-binding sensor domain-containing protein
MGLKFGKKYVLIFLSVCTTLISTLAQHYNFIYYSTESGLAQSQVRSITQDKNGFLWLGTLSGLSKFDGRKFINYSIKNGLLDDQVLSLITDQYTGIWIGTVGGINYFNGKSFLAYPFKKEMGENAVNAITQQKNGELWLATDGAGVCRFDGKQFVYFTSEDGLPDNNVRSLYLDENEHLWCGTKNGMAIYDGKKFRLIDSALSPPRNISHIFSDKHHQLWISTFGEGIYKYDGKAFTNYNEAKGLINNWIRSGMEDVFGRLWFSSKFGVCRFDGKSFTFFDESKGLPSDNTNLMYEDKERNLWIGSDGKGLYKFSVEAFTYLSLKDGLSSNIILSVIEDANKCLWFSTYGKGITKKDELGKSIIYTTENGLNSNTIWASIKDRTNRFWFCTSDGVNCFDGKNFISFSEKDGLDAGKVFSALQDKNGNIWFGTSSGVSVYDGVRFKNYASGIYGIGKDVTSIIEDKKGVLWFGSKSGLFKYSNKQFTKFNAFDNLNNTNISSLAIDSLDNLWIGSRNGISYFDGKTYTRINADTIFNSNTISFLIFDARENLWIGTNGGIYVLDAKAYRETGKTKFKHYTIYDGLPGMECNQNAAFKDHLGNLWMGTTDGVVKFNPLIKDAHSETNEPITHITGIRLFLKDTNWLKMSENIDTITRLPKNLRVSYPTKHFTFDYIGIKFSSPLSVRYKYMLEGFDDNWSSPTEATFATYSNLSSGKYTFKVIAGDGLGNWNKIPIAFSFEILPPFWTRWWFILLCISTGALLLWGIYRLRVSALSKKHETQQLAFQNKLMALEHQSLNSSMNRHFIFNALNSIQYYMNKDDKDSAHKYLSRFAKLIRMNLDGSMNNLSSVSEEIERLELYLQLEQMRFEDKFTYRISVAENIEPEALEIPPMLLQPFVENSIWHGILPDKKDGHIEIRIEYDTNQNVVFSIQDNGIGLEQSNLRKAQRKDLHISRGTVITTQRIQLLGQMNNINITLNGPFDLKNEQNEVIGTRVELILQGNET